MINVFLQCRKSSCKNKLLKCTESISQLYNGLASISMRYCADQSLMHPWLAVTLVAYSNLKQHIFECRKRPLEVQSHGEVTQMLAYSCISVNYGHWWGISIQRVNDTKVLQWDLLRWIQKWGNNILQGEGLE